jgi:hypothetical protein
MLIPGKPLSKRRVLFPKKCRRATPMKHWHKKAQSIGTGAYRLTGKIIQQSTWMNGNN